MKYFILISMFCFVSCSTTIKSSNTLYRANLASAGGGVSDNIQEFHVSTKFKGRVQVQADRVIVTPAAGVVMPTTIISTTPLRLGLQMDGLRPTATSAYYFSKENLVPGATSESFKFKETSIAVQGLSIALKIRGGMTLNGTSYPYQVESGSSYGIGAAYKATWSTFKTSKNIWQSNVNSVSITSGPFLALGSSSIKKSTNAPNLVGQDFTGLTWSPGVFVQFGYNNINFGYALGVDKLFGDASGSWIYDGKLWNGIIVSINIAKF